MHYEQRAEEVVKRFKRMLTSQALDAITDEHFNELETLIEAALGTLDSESKHSLAKRVEALAHELRKESSNAK